MDFSPLWRVHYPARDIEYITARKNIGKEKFTSCMGPLNRSKCSFCATPRSPLQDPQYMQQALTNALLMDAVVGSLQSSKAIYAASKLAHFDRIKTEGRGTLMA